MTPTLWWHEAWVARVGSAPTRPSSREESVQQVLARTFLGLEPADFLKYPLTDDGETVVKAIWNAAFGDGPNQLDWFVSEYELPVPVEWREEIGLTYRAPDFACGTGNRILIIELKTEWGSYTKAQITDFLRLARRLHPDADIDLLLLEERHRRANRNLDRRQRYAEMTWTQLAAILRAELPDHDLAIKLCGFLEENLAGAAAATSASAAAEPSAGERALAEREAPLDAFVATAVDQALHIAPAIEAAPMNTKVARGIDVPFASVADLRIAEVAVRDALLNAGHPGVSTWLWRKTSGGTPATPAGRDTGMELRIQPRR
ncbi:hypothetical protein [Nocardioides pelophilus]|uniref:hypothetical protein n=1 Tax=Nocardioides pelophilus TaxID=2172019 RepID=UPI0016020C08|nr:hypothetical protein [Nocardioides pelophilus]